MAVDISYSAPHSREVLGHAYGRQVASFRETACPDFSVISTAAANLLGDTDPHGLGSRRVGHRQIPVIDFAQDWRRTRLCWHTVATMSSVHPRILSVGTANPPGYYSQGDILEMFRVANPMVRSMFKASHIEGRHLVLPEAGEDGVPREDQDALLRKHRKWSLKLGGEAIARALDDAGLRADEIDYLCCITSTGLMLPGLTAMFIKHLGFRVDCHRADLVGMGCNAGLNGLNPTANWCRANPGRTALMVCCEVNSALYVYDDTMATGVVNSLFGDGCAAVVLRAEDPGDPRPPSRTSTATSSPMPGGPATTGRRSTESSRSTWTGMYRTSSASTPNPRQRLVVSQRPQASRHRPLDHPLRRKESDRCHRQHRHHGSRCAPHRRYPA